MSVLIKGMEMPKNCDSCPCYYETEGAWRNECEVLQREHYITDERPDWCPLVEIPPHGRLIDADALRLLYDFSGYKPTGDMTEEEFDRLMCRLPVIRANIDDAPTIIEAEGER